MSQKTVSDLNTCSKDDFVAALSNVFEYSPWIAERAASMRPFAGVKQLLEAMKLVVDRAAPELRVALIKAHPDLANKTQRAAGLTAESSAEQNSVGLDRLSDAEYDAFEGVNNAYRAKFGFPYIVCVRRHTKDSILRDFERRLPNDATTEAQRSIEEICRIAALRVDQLVASDDRLSVHGRLSTHVLDTDGGDSGRTGRAVRARPKPRGDACGHQRRWPDRSTVDSWPAGANRPLRTDFWRRGLLCRAASGGLGSAVSRFHSIAFFGERPRRPPPRTAVGHALELCDLSGKLVLIPRPHSKAAFHGRAEAAMLPNSACPMARTLLMIGPARGETRPVRNCRLNWRRSNAAHQEQIWQRPGPRHADSS